MSEALSGVLYMVSKYFALLGSMAFAGTTVLCYYLGVLILSKVINKLFSLISREYNNTPVGFSNSRSYGNKGGKGKK